MILDLYYVFVIVNFHERNESLLHDQNAPVFFNALKKLSISFKIYINFIYNISNSLIILINIIFNLNYGWYKTNKIKKNRN